MCFYQADRKNCLSYVQDWIFHWQQWFELSSSGDSSADSSGSFFFFRLTSENTLLLLKTTVLDDYLRFNFRLLDEPAEKVKRLLSD